MYSTEPISSPRATGTNLSRRPRASSLTDDNLEANLPSLVQPPPLLPFLHQEEEEEGHLHSSPPLPNFSKTQLGVAAGMFFLVTVGTFLNHGGSGGGNFAAPHTILTGLKPSVLCKDQACSIKFTGQGVEHHVDLVPESRSLFADNLVVERDGEETIVTKDQLRHVMYETAPGAAEWGAGLVDLDTNTLVSGLFLTKDQQVIEHNIKANRHERALGEDEHVVMEMPGIGQPWLKPVATAAKVQPTIALMAAGGLIPFFPNCFQDDAITQVFKMNVAYDFGLASSFASTADALADLDVLFSVGKLIFLQQLNVRLEVSKVILGTASSPVPLSRGNPAGTCANALGALPEVVSWASSQPRTGFTFMLSNCFSGITGVSYIGSVCSATLNANVAAHSWLVAFHELGHGFGMTHSFENGIGVTGGLMDYGNGLYNGVAQFHPNKRAEVCPFLDYTIPTCAYFTPASLTSSCGDGILTKDETCECLDQGKTSCGKCQNCKASASVECSAKDFLFRTPNMPDTVIVANADYLSDAECCMTDNKLAAPKTLCGEGLVNACSLGQCEQICSVYLDYNNPNCGFDDSGCMLGCVNNGKCTFTLSFMDNGNRVYVSGMPDGTSCLSGESEGTCLNNKCVVSGQKLPPVSDGDTLPSSSSPTTAPTSTTVAVTPCSRLKKKPCQNARQCYWAKARCNTKAQPIQENGV